MQPEATWLSAWTVFAAVATAFAAVIVGPLASLFVASSQNRTALKVAELQFKASVISASRQNWINDLRDVISEFLGALDRMGNAPGIKESALASGETDPEEGNIQRARVLRSRIALLINPLEEDHSHLLRSVDAGVKLAPARYRDAEQAKMAMEVHHDITVAAQQILKREWERVKSGETLTLVKKPV